MGRKAHEPDDKTKNIVKRMSGIGLTQDQIASIVGISDETLRKYYSEELQTGVAHANALVAQNLFNIATGNDKGAVAAAIFWMKTRAQWRETNRSEISGPDGGAIKVEATTVDVGDLTQEQRDALRSIMVSSKVEK